MIQYKRCSEVLMEDIYNAFSIGFSDYIIPLEMPKEQFIKRFFGPEGNSVDHSFIAYDGSTPVGLMLGGIKVYEGIKTLRCGTMCIHPDYRKRGIAQNLFELHLEEGQKNGCSQLFLEVIVGNDPAIKFYEKMGYDKIYDIKFFALEAPLQAKEEESLSYEVTSVEMKDLRLLQEAIHDIHINWQNDFDFIEKIEGQHHFGIHNTEKELVGALSISESGKVYFLWVNPKNRGSKVATALLVHGIKKLNLNKIVSSFPNNNLLEGFYKKLGFKQQQITQYEMYRTL